MKSVHPLLKLVLPIAHAGGDSGHPAWGLDALAAALGDALAPARQMHLACFLRDHQARAAAAERAIAHYSAPPATDSPEAVTIKTPVWRLLAQLTAHSPQLAPLLAERIPNEGVPAFAAKLHLAYNLFALLGPAQGDASHFDLRALLAYWCQELSATQLQQRFERELAQA